MNNAQPPEPLQPPTNQWTTLGRHVYGLGILAMGMVGLVWGDFISGQPVPNNFPHRTALAYSAAVFLFIVGVILQWRRSATTGAVVLAAYYLVIVILLMNGPVLLDHLKVYGTYEDLAEQFAITAAALIVFARCARLNPVTVTHLNLLGQLTFGFCALIFGGAHFRYMNLTAPLVPTWLPPSQAFWGYVTGAAFLAAGLALLTRIQARLAAILLTLMLASFSLLVHIRILFRNHISQWNWTEFAINLAILGAAWVVADSFAPTPTSNPRRHLASTTPPSSHTPPPTRQA